MSTPAENVFAPQATGGSTLGDVLAGIGGAPVNRPALGAAIVNGQALAGLRTAQTENALENAQKAREEAQASNQLEASLTAQGLSPSRAHAAAQIMISGHGNAQQALEALKLSQEVGNRDTLGDVSQLGNPTQTAAQQAIQGKVAEPVNVPNAFTTLPGAYTPDTKLSPIGAVDVAEKGALAHAASTRAANGTNPFAGDPELAGRVAQFVMLNPASASNLRSLVSQGGAQVVDQWLTQNGFPRQGPPPGAAPAPAGPAQLPTTTPTAPAAGAPGAAPGSLPPGAAEPNGPQHTPPNGITPAPGVSLSEQAAIRKDFASGVGAKQTTALNTMAQHSMLFDKIADQLQNGNFQPTNEISQLWARVTGSPVPTNLKIAAEFLGREAVRATVNSGAGTGEERELKVGADASPDQLHGAAQTLRSLAVSQLQSLDLRARRGGVDIRQLLSPTTQQVYGLHDNAAPAAPGAAPGAGGTDLAAAAAAELARRAGAQ